MLATAATIPSSCATPATGTRARVAALLAGARSGR